MTPKQRRTWYLALIALFLGGATLIVLTTLKDHLLYFMTPTDVYAKKPTTVFRLGGVVKAGSLKKDSDGMTITFMVEDGGAKSLPVCYKGLIPDLFREGQGVVAEGMLDHNGVFQASYLLAKHDENYMPREVADALRASGCPK